MGMASSTYSATEAPGLGITGLFTRNARLNEKAARGHAALLLPLCHQKLAASVHSCLCCPSFLSSQSQIRDVHVVACAGSGSVAGCCSCWSSCLGCKHDFAWPRIRLEYASRMPILSLLRCWLRRSRDFGCCRWRPCYLTACLPSSQERHNLVIEWLRVVLLFCFGLVVRSWLP